jgi:hypothetical protein
MIIQLPTNTSQSRGSAAIEVFVLPGHAPKPAVPVLGKNEQPKRRSFADRMTAVAAPKLSSRRNANRIVSR